MSSSPIVPAAPPPWFAATLTALLERRSLDPATMRVVIEDAVQGRCGEVEMAALLVALRSKGETAEELATAASVLRQHMIRLETGRDDVLDTCGTGGDSSGTFNISTATALVVAGAGVPVVKHGNRAVSGRSGSTDALAALGIHAEGDAAWARICFETTGVAFCFAPLFHPALRQVAAVRRRLQVRTLFNCLGPLVNPALSPYQLLGVGRAEWLDPMAGALAQLGTRRALLVHGDDGLDEVSLAGPTRVREVRNGRVTAWEWTPDDFGLAACTAEDLRADGPEQSAAIVCGILRGEDGPAARVVLANAAAALLASERVANVLEGVARAREAIVSGAAQTILERLRACSPERTESR